VAVHYLLEQTNKLTNGTWTAVTIPGRSVGADYSATFTMSNKVDFFQLQMP